ncbi:MAG: F0F1 ATP synthase subunit epsilon [Candidatus Binataceae bacterium]
MMRLVITTPMTVVADIAEVVHVRAEDETGSFGILEHHDEFLTALAVSVVSWRQASGHEGHCAVRGGVLSVSGGKEVEIATRQAVLGDDLGHLADKVVAELKREAEQEETAWTHAAGMRLRVLRELSRSTAPSGGAHPRHPFGGEEQ